MSQSVFSVEVFLGWGFLKFRCAEGFFVLYFKKRFQAEAEKKRALAVAQEAEYTAEVQKNRALVVLAEAEVPKAMAEAFRQGQGRGSG